MTTSLSLRKSALAAAACVALGTQAISVPAFAEDAAFIPGYTPTPGVEQNYDVDTLAFADLETAAGSHVQKVTTTDGARFDKETKGIYLPVKSATKSIVNGAEVLTISYAGSYAIFQDCDDETQPSVESCTLQTYSDTKVVLDSSSGMSLHTNRGTAIAGDHWQPLPDKSPDIVNFGTWPAFYKINVDTRVVTWNKVKTGPTVYAPLTFSYVDPAEGFSAGYQFSSDESKLKPQYFGSFHAQGSAPESVTKREPSSFTVSVDNKNLDMSYSIVPPVNGVSVEPNTGVVTITAGADQASPLTFTVRAQAGNQYQDLNYSVKVNDQAQPEQGSSAGIGVAIVALLGAIAGGVVWAKQQGLFPELLANIHLPF